MKLKRELLLKADVEALSWSCILGAEGSLGFNPPNVPPSPSLQSELALKTFSWSKFKFLKQLSYDGDNLVSYGPSFTKLARMVPLMILMY